jgi:hypothetical protein
LVFNHASEGKGDFALNLRLFEYKNLLTSFYFKKAFSQETPEFDGKLKLKLDDNKLFTLGFTKDYSLSPFSAYHYFKNLSLGASYALTPSKGLNLMVSAVALVDVEKINCGGGCLTLGADYKKFVNTLKVGKAVKGGMNK